MDKHKTGRWIDNAFLIGVLGKAIGGLFELMGGITLIFISTARLHQLLEPLNHVNLHIADEISSGAKLFIIFYLSSRGVIRIGLAYLLLHEKLWAYPVTLIFLAASVVYQIYLMFHHFSSGLLWLTLFDLVVIALTFYEYRKLKAGGHLSYPKLP